MFLASDKNCQKHTINITKQVTTIQQLHKQDKSELQGRPKKPDLLEHW